MKTRLLSLAIALAGLGFVAPHALPAPEAAATSRDGQVMGGLSSATTTQTTAAAQTLAYWTPERMAAAQELRLPAPDPAAETGPEQTDARHPAARIISVRASAPAAPRARRSGLTAVARPYTSASKRVFGRMFMRYGSQDSVCSATAVTSRSHSLVWTAGHCLYWDGQHATNVLFAPAYSNSGFGDTPFGRWPATRIHLPARWQGKNFAYDYAGFTVATVNGRRLTDVVGGEGIRFNDSDERSTTIWGYPAESKYGFDGQTQYNCTNQAQLNSYDMTVICRGIGGMSGGAWTVGDQLWAVNSRSDRKAKTWGTRLTSQAYEFYQDAQD